MDFIFLSILCFYNIPSSHDIGQVFWKDNLFFSFFFVITYLVDETRKKHEQNPHQTVNKISIILKRTSGLQI